MTKSNEKLVTTIGIAIIAIIALVAGATCGEYDNQKVEASTTTKYGELSGYLNDGGGRSNIKVYEDDHGITVTNEFGYD